MLPLDKYLTVKELAEEWNISAWMVIHYCDKGLIPDAVKKRSVWLIPNTVSKPEDRRCKAYRQKKGVQ